MNIYEALKFAKEQGKKVRPKCWHNYQAPPINYVEWVESESAFEDYNQHYKSWGRLYLQGGDDELLGEWEVAE